MRSIRDRKKEGRKTVIRASRLLALGPDGDNCGSVSNVAFEFQTLQFEASGREKPVLFPRWPAFFPPTHVDREKKKK